MSELTVEQINQIMDTINMNDINKLSQDDKNELMNIINEDKSLSDNEKFIKCGVISFGGKKNFLIECQKCANTYEEKHNTT